MTYPWHRRSILGSAVACGLCLGIHPAAQAADEFQGLGGLHAGGSSEALGVSADGSTVVGRATTGVGDTLHAFRWDTTTRTMQDLGTLSGGALFDSVAYDVSADGSFVVGYSDLSGGREAFRWSAATNTMIGLGDLPGGTEVSTAFGVSADGSVVVGDGRSANGTEAFRWTAARGGMIGLGDLPDGDFDSQAFDVSADGSVVVGRGYGNLGDEAFRWTADSDMVGLGGQIVGGEIDSRARGVSADGSVVVGADDGEAFRWNTATSTMVGLGDLPGGSFSSSAAAVSADGSVIVGVGRTPLGSEAAVWDDGDGRGRVRNLREVLTNDFGLDLTGWRLEAASGVSDDGLTIVGVGYNPNGVLKAWRAHVDAKWISTASGNWASNPNWAMGITPNELHDILITPENGLRVTGPSSGATIKSLTIGATSVGVATLDIPRTSSITVNNLTTIRPQGQLTGDGVFNALGGIDNQGLIDLGTNSLSVAGGTLANTGLIQGNGQIGNTLNNNANGEVRVENGRRIRFTGTKNENDRNARISMLGGTLEFADDLTNRGRIIGHGTLITEGTLTNVAGTLAFSGDTDVLGDVDNQDTIIVSGNSRATFFDDVVHSGTEIRVSEGSVAVFFGDVSGMGSYTGGGDVHYEGTYNPGSSPGHVTFDGDVSLAPNATLVMELGGLTQGDQYDALSITGALTLGGTLDVRLIDGFAPSAGDTFDLFDTAAITGDFDDVALASLRGGLSFDLSSLATDGLLIVVPEPGSGTLLAIGGLLLGRRRRAA